MAKKIISLLMMLAVVASCCSFTSLAQDADSSNNRRIEYLEDGSFIVTEIVINNMNRSTGSVSGYKDINFYSGSGNLQWKFRLVGSFIYTGEGAMCTNCSHVVNIYDSSWKTASQSSSKNGNTAYGNVTMYYYLVAVHTDTIQRSCSLSCDKDGNLS